MSFYPPFLQTGPEQKRRKRPYNCTKCPTSFCGVVAWKMHQRLHGAEFPFKCNKCDYAVRNRGNLSWHLKIHSRHDNFDVV
jgi:KRAB domain-containing zinc finger protein